MSFFYKDFKKDIAASIDQPLTFSIALFFLITVLGLVHSEDLLEGMRRSKIIVNFIPIYVMVSIFIDMEEDSTKRLDRSEHLLLFFVAGLFVLDIIGLLSYFDSIDRQHVLPLSPFNIHHIWFGNLNSIGLYIAFFLLLFSSSRNVTFVSIFLFSFLIVGSISVLMSTSRTAWLGIISVCFVCAYLLFDRRKFLIVVLMIFCAIALLYFLHPIVHTRVELIFSHILQFTTGITKTSIGTRLMMWQASLKMFISNPLFGVGTGDYPLVISQYAKSGEFPQFLLRYNQPHNMFLFVMATNGLIGLMALFVVFYNIFCISFKMIKSNAKERLFGFIAFSVSMHFLVAGQTESLIYIHSLICTFAFVMGVCIRASNNKIALTSEASGVQ